jgi:hypothetical protein
MIWAGHVARIEKKKGVYRVLVGKPDKRDQWRDPGVDGRIIVGWMFRSGMWGYGLDWAGSG